MNEMTAEISRRLDSVIPGVSAAFERLRAANGMGIYTSCGAFYNHTLFGRDASSAAKFVNNFEHQVSLETIIALAALQGYHDDPITQEQRGRIHHELRDFTTWKGSLAERIGFSLLGSSWGVADKQLLSYFAVDTTASYIRLVNKYANNTDKAVLKKKLTNRHGNTVTIAETVAMAAEWICRQIDEHDRFVQLRQNARSLPYQTYQDSLTAYVWQDGQLLNYKHPVAYIETQAFAIDALEDATKLLPDHPARHDWQHAAHTLRDTLVNDYWDDIKKYFVSAIDVRGKLDSHNVSVGWILNNTLWDELPKKLAEQRVTAIVTTLFSDEFLTPVGLRTKSITQNKPMRDVVEYHDAWTVWPMFTFMVIEGLRRQKLFRLAEQLENRLINGINVSGTFSEFFIVDPTGVLLVPAKDDTKPTRRVKVQMIPEQTIAFTVVPAMTLAHHASYDGRKGGSHSGWRKQLEDTVLHSIEIVERQSAENALQAMGPVEYVQFSRFGGALKTAWHYYNKSRSLQ